MMNEETDEIAKVFVSLTTLSMLSCKPIVFLLSGLCEIISPESLRLQQLALHNAGWTIHRSCSAAV